MARVLRAPAITFRHCRPEDVLEMSAYIREADRQECWMAARVMPETAIWAALETSVMAWTAWDGSLPVAMFGVSPWSLLGGVGCPWLIGTDAMEHRARALVVAGRYYTGVMRATFPRLENYVIATNTGAVRWLRWLGFHVEQPRAWGAYGVPFHRFTIGA